MTPRPSSGVQPTSIATENTPCWKQSPRTQHRFRRRSRRCAYLVVVRNEYFQDNFLSTYKYAYLFPVKTPSPPFAQMVNVGDPSPSVSDVSKPTLHPSGHVGHMVVSLCAIPQRHRRGHDTGHTVVSQQKPVSCTTPDIVAGVYNRHNHATQHKQRGYQSSLEGFRKTASQSTSIPIDWH